ncbi:MAG: hypothetical protein ILNGONEN_01513 [Syntrophorhabdaceae bacterium]|jgi:hypothetical protein|nr:hypothetical protein [Syntrophorhabdaceae bacterium]
MKIFYLVFLCVLCGLCEIQGLFLRFSNPSLFSKVSDYVDNYDYWL